MAVGILCLQQGLDVSKKSDEEFQSTRAKYSSSESLRRNQSYSQMSQGINTLLYQDVSTALSYQTIY